MVIASIVKDTMYQNSLEHGLAFLLREAFHESRNLDEFRCRSISPRLQQLLLSSLCNVDVPKSDFQDSILLLAYTKVQNFWSDSGTVIGILDVVVVLDYISQLDGFVCFSKSDH